MNIVCVSSSIENWREKILKKYNAIEYNPKVHLKKRVLFFGLYSKNDCLRVWKHKGEKVVIWCGADILYLGQFRNWWRKWLLRLTKVRHICENFKEQEKLRKYGIKAEIIYNFFDDPSKYPISFKPSDSPQIWMISRPNRGRDY